MPREKDIEKEYILASISDGFMAVDSQWRFTYINNACERMLSIKKDDALGRSMWDVFPEARQSVFFDEYHKAVMIKESTHFEAYYDPMKKWFSVNAYPYADGLVIFFLDITIQKEIQDKIVNDAQRIRAIINNTKDIIWSIDRDLNIIEANNAFWERLQSMTGKAPEHITRDDFNTDELGQWASYIERAFNGEAFKTVQAEMLNGEHRFAEISFNPIPDKDNKIVGVSCFSRDITHQVNYQNKIESQNALFKEIAWLQSHKVRNHVATLLGLTMLFKENKPDDPDNMQIIDGLIETVQKLDDVIREINNKTQGLE